MNIRKDQNSALNLLMGMMDNAVGYGAMQAKKAWLTCLSATQRKASANEPLYMPARSLAKKYRRGVKKRAKVSTIHSILSIPCQNVLSKEIGRYAAWLLGLRPFLNPLSPCQNKHSPTVDR
ncbi:hypothetical protein H3H36_10900 [Duganella sp. FT3S]|uniref:Transposase n=1 Tax=Rugamonas fusca TaxID=2758568 RepID=A0A7W2I6U5_9BURK|nr:hypothetical protein [Rugamonas fusca]MBA5605867.1 hypothetical protein [Rugamonas fusca]